MPKQVLKALVKRKNKQGKVFFWARIRWFDADGTERNRYRKGESKAHAKTLLDQLAGKYLAGGAKAFEVEKLTFSQLAEEFRAKKLVEPVYAGATRIAGMRSWKNRQGDLKPLEVYFGAYIVQEINYEDLVSYRQARFQLKTRRGAERSISSVNRELSLMRTILNYARRCGYISRSPFEVGDSLISLADEVKRDRILTREEEKKLLAQCVGRRAHLRPIIIAALDTALRKGELLQLQWRDIDMTERKIYVRATTTKTMRGRPIGITARLWAELDKLRLKGRELPGEMDFVFGGIKEFKKAWLGAVEDAGLEDLRFHDLRHTATTRIVSTGLPSALAMTITGHTQFATFKRYVNVDDDAARRAAALLDELEAKENPEESGDSSGDYVN